MLRIRQVMQRTGLARSTVYAKIAAGAFPAPVNLGVGARSVGWVESDVEDWLMEQITRSRQHRASSSDNRAVKGGLKE